MVYQEFNGIRFYQTEPTDYFRHSENGKVILMHRYVWEYYNCPIPKGYHIHHIDGDKSNNDISNLALLQGAEHWKLHGRLLTDEEREWKRQNIIKNAVPKAKAWHRTDEGRAWHKEHMEKCKDALHKKVGKVCLNCDTPYLGETKSKFCSNACKSAYRRKMKVDLIDYTCVVCGGTFKSSKSRGAKCCSPRCRAIYGHSQRQPK